MCCIFVIEYKPLENWCAGLWAGGTNKLDYASGLSYPSICVRLLHYLYVSPSWTQRARWRRGSNKHMTVERMLLFKTITFTYNITPLKYRNPTASTVRVRIKCIVVAFPRSTKPREYD